MNYIDLGLPSGTLWAEQNEEGFYTFDKAVETYKGHLPSVNQFLELLNTCSWQWHDNHYTITGPNGNSIDLPAAGFRYRGGSVSDVGEYGYYWSSAAAGSEGAMYLYFNSGKVGLTSNYRCHGFSVRLVRK